MLIFNNYFKDLIKLLYSIPAFLSVMKEYDKNNIVDKTPLKEYDYIVIGAGAAGSVVANRLSEDPNTTVLLLEAGGCDSLIQDIPLLAPAAQLTRLDWKYTTTSQKNGNTGLCNNVGRVPRGKVIGGSSTLHYMMYTRGNRLDYDNWEKSCGIKGWSYEENLPFFKKSEEIKNLLPYSDLDDLHGKDGELTVNFMGKESPLEKAFIDAGKQFGYHKVDYNGPQQTGFSYVQATTRNGTRCSSAKAFLKNIQGRKNLDISLNSFVTKLLIDDQKRTYGVQFEKNNQVLEVRARKEIILSAGAYSSPQILMLSGIGPKDHLKELNITVIHHLPGVGQNMQDHVSAAAVVYEMDQTYAPNLTKEFFVDAISTYIKNGSGPFSSPVGVEGVAFVRSRYDEPTVDFPDLQLVFLTMSSLGLEATKDLYNICNEVWDGYFKPMLGKHVAVVYPILMRPKSRGELKLSSSNPHQLPLINPRLFQDQDNMDLKVLGDGIKFSVDLALTEAFKKIGINYTAPVMPGCEHISRNTTEYWRCLAQKTTITFYDTVATCSMGPSTNPNAVVDERLRVYGIKNLRIADASVIPLEITGNVNIPTVMVGERAADFIKKDN